MASKYFTTKAYPKKRSRKEDRELAYMTAFHTFIVISLLVLHDKFGFGGQKRLVVYLEEVKKMIGAYGEGYLNLKDLENALKEECGLTIKA